jgi:hypothetical protein
MTVTFFITNLTKSPSAGMLAQNGGLMTAKPTRYFWIILLTLLTACGTTPQATEMPTITAPPSTETMTPLPTFTPNAEMPSPLPTFTPPVAFESLPTATATFAPKPIPVSTATETFSLDNLRMAYIVDGNLYVQNGSNPPTQLSDNGKDIYPIFSDDGEKIVFYRGRTNENNSIFSINADGSHIQEIITKDWLDTFGVDAKAGHLAFIPNTHQLLFNTYFCPEGPQNIDKKCPVGLFLADTDTGEIKTIMQPETGSHLPWDGNSRWGGNFSISPDGKLVSVAYAGQIDILDMDGKTVHRNIINYVRSVPIEFYPRVYWLSNSNNLIIALPIEAQYYMNASPQYIIWRYALDKKTATQISLDPLPTWAHMESNDVLSVSPNREWALYFADGYKLYKGNLLDGSAELLMPYGYFLPTRWSSDNMRLEDFLGSIDAPPTIPPGSFLGWIDAKRFIYFLDSACKNNDDIQIFVGEINGETVLSYESNVFIPNPKLAPCIESFVFTIWEDK